jgi:ribonuclease BN (tRNA processing enzyme)
MKIRFLGAHNCESESSRLMSLLIDDILAIDAGAITSSLSFEAQQKIKAILLTHHHYDHVRDIPALGMNLFLHGARTNVYSIPAVRDIVTSHLLDDEIYPNFHQRPPSKPTINFNIIEPLKSELIEGYSVLAVPVSHGVPAVGYQLTSPDGKTVFHTSDTGPGLAGCWRHVSPQLLIIEVTTPDRYREVAAEAGHLSPSLLKEELISFREIKGYLPRVATVHMNPALEKEIAAEVAAVERELDASITMGYEGMELKL